MPSPHPETGSIRIGKLSARRWREYRNLRLEALKSVPSAFGSSFEEEARYGEEVWRSRVGSVFFAFSDGKPVGMLSCVYNDRIKTRHIAHIFGVYVTPGHRGRGTGTLLLQKALSEARSKGDVVKVQLSVNPALLHAVSLYRKAGFDVVGRPRRELKVGGRYYDMLLMEKEIR